MSDDQASREAFTWELRRALIAQLRVSWHAMGEMANEQRMAAAETIEALIDELQACKREVVNATEDIQFLHESCEAASLAADVLLNQRDEARREVCRHRAACIQGKRAEEIADALNWDCFSALERMSKDAAIEGGANRRHFSTTTAETIRTEEP